MPRQITLAQLRSAGACKSQLVLFEKLFGVEVTLTEEIARQYGPEFDIEWAAMNLLSPFAYNSYIAATATARATLDATIASIYIKFAPAMDDAYDAHAAAVDAADDAHAAAVDAAYDAHSAAVAPILAAREAALALIRAPYDNTSAMAFVRTYLADE